MRMNGMRSAILIAWMVPVLAGCGTSSSITRKSDTGTAMNPLTAACEATGGAAA